MRILVLLLFAFPFLGYAQDYHDYYKEKQVDSVQYYQQQLRSMQRQVADSLRQSEAYQAAVQGLKRHQVRSDNYSAFTLYAEALSADYSAFNNQLHTAGFSSLSGPLYRFGIGFTSKQNRTVLDLIFLVPGFGKKAKKGDESLTTTVQNFFQINLGYDIVKAQRFNVFPYVGISARDAMLTYKKPAPEITNPTTFLDHLQGDKYTSASSVKVGYEAGIGMDLQIAGNQPNTGGTMLFARIGTSGPIGKEKYKTDHSSFDPGIKYGQLAVALGFKFFGRK